MFSYYIYFGWLAGGLVVGISASLRLGLLC